MNISINLLVLRCRDIEATRRFYELLGVVFTKESHRSGPEHYSWESAGLVLELYPVAVGQAPDKVLLGFSTPSLAELLEKVPHVPEATVLKPLHTTSERLVVLLQDPDGRKVEVSQPLLL